MMTGASEALLLLVMTDMLLPECIQLILDELVCYYHQVRPKFKYKEILSIIASHHRVPITYSTFKSIYERERLNRKKDVTNRELKMLLGMNCHWLATDRGQNALF